MGSEEEKVKNLQRAQLLSQQLRALEDQLQILERRRQEISIALEELKKAEERGENEVYQFLGANILIKKDINSVKTELEEEITMLDSRINMLKKQIDVGRKELERLLQQLGYVTERVKGSGG